MLARSAIPLLIASLAILPACANSGNATTVSAAASAAPKADWIITLPTRRCGDFFIVDTMINGQGPFAMVLDSGASVTVISKSVGRQIGLRGRIDKLSFGPVTVSNARTQVRNLDHLEHAFNTDFDGIIGHPVFSKYTIIYDYPAGQVRLTNSHFSSRAPGALRTPNPRHPVIPIRIGADTIRAVVDTGSARTLSLDDLDDYAFASGPFALGVSARINRVHIARAGRLAENATFGAITLNSPIVSESDSGNLLGQGVLRNFIVSFDQQERAVRFQRPDAALEDPIDFPSRYGHGAILNATADGLLVHDVAPQSPAERAGLRAGDTVIAIDGRTLADLGCEIRETKDDAPRAMELTLRRADETVNIELTTDLLIP